MSAVQARQHGRGPQCQVPLVCLPTYWLSEATPRAHCSAESKYGYGRKKQPVNGASLGSAAYAAVFRRWVPSSQSACVAKVGRYPGPPGRQPANPRPAAKPAREQGTAGVRGCGGAGAVSRCGRLCGRRWSQVWAEPPCLLSRVPPLLCGASAVPNDNPRPHHPPTPAQANGSHAACTECRQQCVPYRPSS